MASVDQHCDTLDEPEEEKLKHDEGKSKNIYMTWKGKLSRVTLMIMMFRTHQRGLKKPPPQIQDPRTILLQPETTRESPSIEKQDMSHLPKRKEQPQSPNTNVNLPLRTEQPISREIQDDSPKSRSPEASEDGTSSEVQNTSHGSGSSNDHVTDTSWLNILAFSLKHNVTGALMEDLLKLLRLCSGDAASKYMLEKAFEDFVDNQNAIIIVVFAALTLAFRCLRTVN